MGGDGLVCRSAFGAVETLRFASQLSLLLIYEGILTVPLHQPERRMVHFDGKIILPGTYAGEGWFREARLPTAALYPLMALTGEP